MAVMIAAAWAHELFDLRLFLSSPPVSSNERSRMRDADLAVQPAQQVGVLSSRSRSGAVYGLVQWLQLEDRVPRRQIVECFHCRSLRDGEEALHLAGEAVKIGFENRRTPARPHEPATEAEQ
jgi:hypothetical protein